MPNNFTKALENTSKFEGTKRVKEPTGDSSVRGIRQNVYDAYNRQLGLPTKDVGKLTAKERANFVREVFVTRPKINQLPPEIFNAVFDFGFNSGPSDAIKALQTIVGAKPDGLIGPQTLGKVNTVLQQVGKDVFLDKYQNARQTHVSNVKGINDYQAGLKERVDSFRGNANNTDPFKSQAATEERKLLDMTEAHQRAMGGF